MHIWVDFASFAREIIEIYLENYAFALQETKCEFWYICSVVNHVT